MTAAVGGQEFLERYFRDCAGANFELRVLDIQRKKTELIFRQGYDDTALLVQDAERFAKRHNIYFNTAALNGGFSEEHAVAVPALRIDLDFKRGITEAAARHMLAAFPLPPSAIIQTGGGLQPHWFLTEPAGPSDFALVKAVIKALALTFRADKNACDIPRILRLPLLGARNFKPEYDPPRPVVLSREDWHPEREYALSDFVALLPVEGNVQSLPSEKMPEDSADKLPVKLLDAVFENCAELDGMRRNAIEAGRLLPDDNPGEHMARVRVANLYRTFEGGEDRAVREVFSHLEDFNARETEKQLASLRGAPPPCAELCPAGPCEAIRTLGKSSPVGFAYAARREEQKTPPPQGRPLLESVSVLLENPPRPTWFVEGRIETPSSAMVFGASGTGKSFVALDLAIGAATGGLWAGIKVNAPGFVVYMAGEGRAGLLRRTKAWEIHHKTKIPDGRLYVSGTRLPLDEAGAEKLENAIAERVQETGNNPSLIVVDTLARHMRDGGNENHTPDMNEFINRLDRLRDRFGCVVLVVHHTGHAEQDRARGASSNKAAMDTEIRVNKRGGSRVMEWTKMRDCPDDPAPQEFTLKPVLLEATEDGELVRSAVVSWKGAAPSSARVEMTRTEALGMNTLRFAIIKGGGLSASVDAWREEFYGKHWGDNDAAKQKAHRRIRESLFAKGFVRIQDGLYSLADSRTDTDIDGHCPGASADRHGHTPIGVSVCPALSGEEGSAQYNLPRRTT